MNSPSIPSGRIRRRRRALLYGGLAALVLLLLLLVLADAVFQPRLREGGGGFPNPVRVVWEWFFPPPVFTMSIDWDFDGHVEQFQPLQEPIDDPPPE
jgi:hypothetical protein